MDMFGLYKVQILLLGLLVVPALTSKLPCFDEDKLEDAADRKLKHHYPAPSSRPGSGAVAESGDAAECPVKLYGQLNGALSNRSVSPWRYIRDSKEDRFPRTLVVAQCLCKGCIIGRIHDRSYNSAQVRQSRVVLKKELCEDGKRYRLVPKNELVAVGCTCLKPDTEV